MSLIAKIAILGIIRSTAAVAGFMGSRSKCQHCNNLKSLVFLGNRAGQGRREEGPRTAEPTPDHPHLPGGRASQPGRHHCGLLHALAVQAGLTSSQHLRPKCRCHFSRWTLMSMWSPAGPGAFFPPAVPQRDSLVRHVCQPAPVQGSPWRGEALREDGSV